MIDRDWKPVKHGTPEPYLLVVLALKTGREIPGWWTGAQWDGRRLKEGDVVVAWKRSESQTNNVGHSISSRSK